MKHHYKFLSIVLAGGMLTACSSDEPGTISQPTPASFSAQIGNAVSRAAGSEWTAGDAIGISGVSGGKTYSNVKYTTASSDGDFAPADNGIFYQSPDAVTFTAYYPYSAELDADGTIRVNTADQSQQASFDFLWAQATGSYEYPEVRFNFGHRMAQVNLRFTNGNDVDLTDLTFTVDGLIADGTFDTATGEVAASGDEATITAPVTAEHKSSLIVFPQAAERLVINAQADGNQYRCYLYLGSLASGSSYNVNIAVSKTEMTVTDCAITPWGDGGNNEAELDPMEPKIGDKKPSEASIGDFYMNDGSLVDKNATLTDEQKAACIGVVFSADPSRMGNGAKAALAAKGITPHGLVIALTNATSNEPHWSNKTINEPGLTETANLQKMYQNVDGYAETHQIIDNYDALQSDYTAFYFVSRYGMAGSDTEKYAAPVKSTGWFMPSIGQWWDIMRNLGGISDLDNYKDNTSKDYIRLDNQGNVARNNINVSLSKIPGAGTIEKGDRLWTSSEFNEMNAVGVYFNSDGSFYFSSNYKSMLVYYVRPVLAF